jgi:Prokaryotic membrane lipoprotein lipid attachment site
MKRSLLVLTLVAVLAGCASPLDLRTAARVVIPANTTLGQTSWTPSEYDLERLENQLGVLFNNPDRRLTGISEALAPYPLRDYVIRYTVAGPTDNIFILGEAVHTSRPEAKTQLDPNAPGIDPKAVSGAFYFTVLYDVKSSTLREVHFNMP